MYREDQHVFDKDPSEPTLEIVRDQLKNQSVAPELEETKRKFEQIFDKLPAVATEILSQYKSACDSLAINPGKIRLYLVGGRVRGTELKIDSDLDLVFKTEVPKQSLGGLRINKSDPMDALDERNILQQKLIKNVAAICEASGIANEFHILDYGSLETVDKDSKDKLLLGEI